MIRQGNEGAHLDGVALCSADEDSVEEIDELSRGTQQKAAVHGLLRDLYQHSWRYPTGIVAHSSSLDGKPD